MTYNQSYVNEVQKVYGPHCAPELLHFACEDLNPCCDPTPRFEGPGTEKLKITIRGYLQCSIACCS